MMNDLIANTPVWLVFLIAFTAWCGLLWLCVVLEESAAPDVLPSRQILAGRKCGCGTIFWTSESYRRHCDDCSKALGLIDDGIFMPKLICCRCDDLFISDGSSAHCDSCRSEQEVKPAIPSSRIQELENDLRSAELQNGLDDWFDRKSPKSRDNK